MAVSRRKLDSEDLRERFLGYIRGGSGVYAACHMVGIKPDTYHSYLKVHPEFQESIDAALDASIEPVVEMLREGALEGDVTAAKAYLAQVAPPTRAEKAQQRREVEVTVRHELDPAQINDIRQLEEMVRARERAAIEAAAEEYEDAEIIEDGAD